MFFFLNRSNLDPFERHTDRELWEAVEKCRVKGMVSADNYLIDMSKI